MASCSVRRLAQHAIVGVGFSTFVATAAVAGLGSPAEQTPAIAVPAPTVAISDPLAPPAAPAADQLAAERAAAKARQSRGKLPEPSSLLKSKRPNGPSP